MRYFIPIIFLCSINLSAQSETEERVVIAYLQPLETEIVSEMTSCISIQPWSLYHEDENRYKYTPLVSKIYDEPEYIMVEQEPATVNTDVYPPVHRNSPGLNRRIYTYSDIYYSPNR